MAIISVAPKNIDAANQLPSRGVAQVTSRGRNDASSGWPRRFNCTVVVAIALPIRQARLPLFITSVIRRFGRLSFVDRDDVTDLIRLEADEGGTRNFGYDGHVIKLAEDAFDPDR